MKTSPMLLIVLLACLFAAVPVIAVDCSSARSSQERDAVVDAWRDGAGDFIFQVWSISRENLSLEERQKRYEQGTRKLFSKARELGIGTEALAVLVQNCIDEQEANRRPPAGWDPDDAKRNLALFSETSTRIVQLHLQLFAYARKHCR